MSAPYEQPKDKPVDTASFPDLKGKVALVTGSSSGIGAATAVAFVKNGSKVALHGRNVERLNEVRDFCIKEGATEDQVFCVSGDLTLKGVPEKVVTDTVTHYGKLDILINNAGGADVKSFENASPEFLDEVYNSNTRAVYHLTQLALSYLKQSKGTIVIVSSIFGIIPVPQTISYAMSKAMVTMFAKSLALDLAKCDVRVNTVSPGWVQTGVLRQTQFIDKNVSKEEFIKQAKQIYDKSAPVHPLGRCGWSEEIAQTNLFLASNVSAFVTGHDFVIDGGATLTSSSNFLSPENIQKD